MLLPSDVARLVLGYLQEEGLSATSRAFIHESPNLKEYAEHSSGDGTVPACVFSLFGKNLTTLLNEYVAVRAKESGHEVPLVMTSLWKKLDFTLNQIKSLQNSPSISKSQRLRSRIGVANMARQRVLTVATTSSVVCSSVSETSSIISPAQTSHCMVSHPTPVSFSGPHNRAAAAQQLIYDGGRLLNTSRDSPVQVVVSEQRLNSGPLSPARRKWDTPRKRSGPSGPSAPSRSAPAASSLGAEAEPEEAVDENFPQLVIQNACDKILGDRLLQEKLAENINKILANEPTPPTSKASVSTVEAEQSIDEILGLQGEIHMSDDAIHDILEQTESDPAFQALFDLFDYNKTKSPDEEAVDGHTGSSLDEAAQASSAVQPLQSHVEGPTHVDASVSGIQPAALKVRAAPEIRAAPERKTRKSTVSTVVKKTVLDSGGRASRIENSSARLLVTHGDPQGATSAALNSGRKEKPNLLIDSGGVTQMDIDEPLHTPSPPPLDSLVSQEHTSTSTASCLGKSVPVPSADGPTTFTDASNVNKTSNEQLSKIISFPVMDQPDFFSSVAGCTPRPSGSATENTLAASSVPATAVSVTVTSPSSSAPILAPASSTSATPLSPALSCAPVAATPTPSATHPSTLCMATDSSNMVSLKIIVSDSQDEDASSDAALSRAISSISGDKIPTIYLSSPAKSPECPATPKANYDEVAQAVSGLQSSEACGTPLSCKAAAVNTAPFVGTPQNQQRFIVQLPVDAASPGLQAAAASFYLLTPTTDVQPRQVLLPAGVSHGSPLPANQHRGTTPTYPQSFSTGSAFILPSPMKPVVLPVSVLGQSAAGTQLQLVDPSNPAPVQQKESSPTTVATKPASGADKRVPAVVQGEKSRQQDAAKSSSHKRILCFDSSSPEIQPQSAKATETETFPAASKTSASQPVQQPEKDGRTKPNILGGNKPKRRIAPVQCTSAPRAGATSLKQSGPPQMQQKDSVKKNARKQVYSVHDKDPEAEKRSEPEEASTADGCNGEVKAKDARGSRSNESALKPGSRKDREEGSRKEAADKAPARLREGRPEKRTPSQEVPNVRSNKENEMKGSMPEQQQPSAPSSSASRDFSPPAVTQPSPRTQPNTPKPPSKASSLAKQAVEMLQGLGSPSTPVKKPGAGSPELRLPGTDRTIETPADCPRTPSRHRKGKEGESTPRHLIPPNASDVPTCSPASEAGSENSINMAAHTLMILSRAAIARTGTPLKDSMRQEGAGEKEPTSSKNSENKKRKRTSPADSPPAKRESKRSPSRKKDQERKKLIDCFPHDLDVEKFLSSLHYDE